MEGSNFAKPTFARPVGLRTVFSNITVNDIFDLVIRNIYDSGNVYKDDLRTFKSK